MYHLAAESHVDASLESPASAMSTNAVGTTLAAAFCASAEIPMLYCSTDEVYGDLYNTSWETAGASEGMTPIDPSSPYSAGKAAGEHAVRAYCRSFGLRAVITRGCNAFGPWQAPEKLVPICCIGLARGEPVPMHGGGVAVRQFVHVREFVLCMSLAMERLRGGKTAPGGRPEVFNIAGRRRASPRELLDALADRCGIEGAYYWKDVPDRPGQDRAYSVSGAAAACSLGFEASVDILSPDILCALLNHYADSGAEAVHASFAVG